MTLPSTKPPSEVKAPFLWRTRGGAFVTPADMETRHLYFTVRMIWNHSVPDQYKLKPYTRYTFCSFYVSGYMSEAIKNMLVELSTRQDLPD